MILSARLINIQRWKDITLNFHPGINLIIGDTDSGKSAIYRGLFWLMTNKSPGIETLMNWDADEMSSSITTSDNDVITRLRTKSKNEYHLNDEEIFAGFGVKVPEPIQHALNVTDICFQEQKDQFYLLNSNASEVAKILNKAADLQVIDTALSNSEKENRRVAAQLKAIGIEVEELEDELKAYTYLEEMEGDLEDLEGWEKQLNNINRNISKLNKLKDSHAELEKERESLEIFRDAEEDITSLLEDSQKLTDTKSIILQITNLRNHYQSLIKEQEGLVVFINAGKELDKLLKFSESLESIRKDYRNLNSLKENFLKLKEEKEEVEKELSESLKKLKTKLPKKCENCWVLEEE